jgi:hypothetical protein
MDGDLKDIEVRPLAGCALRYATISPLIFAQQCRRRYNHFRIIERLRLFFCPQAHIRSGADVNQVDGSFLGHAHRVSCRSRGRPGPFALFTFDVWELALLRAGRRLPLRYAVEWAAPVIVCPCLEQVVRGCLLGQAPPPLTG